MSDDSPESLGDDPTYVGRGKEREDQSLGDQSTYAGSNESSLGDLGGLGDDLGDSLAGLEIVDLESRYTIIRPIGKGGMGEVFLATDTRLNRKVAIKRILGSAARSKTAVSRFLIEAQSIAALNHLNIVQIHDYGRAKDGPFLIMEYVAGISLLEKCREGAIPLEEAIDLACQLCDGLGKAHAANIIHRDIKPANILLTEDGIPKLTDFGLAKAEAKDTGMTMAGAVLGTLDFMPPEQRRDAVEVDARSDLWALAATFYQMVTGKSPKIIKFNDVPKSFHDVLGKALEDEKEDRYQTARDFRDALKASQLASSDELELEEGDCPHCGKKNPATRKFCRSCAESLEVPCLSCSTNIPMWEEVCDGCGTKQGELLEQARKLMASNQSEAENLLKGLDFDGAKDLAVNLRDEPDIRLQHFKTWADGFLPQIEKGREQEHLRIGGLLEEALAHRQAHDYAAGLRALQPIPSVLTETAVNGLTVGDLRTELQSTLDEAKRLERVIREGVSKRKVDGLLPEIEKLQTIQPPREDLEKLHKQLTKRNLKLRGLLIEREQKNAAAVASILENARLLRQQCQFEAAEESLRRISEELTTEESTNLQVNCQALGLSKSGAFEALSMAMQTEDYQRGLNLASAYRTTLAGEGLTDGSFNQAYAACQSALNVKLEAAAAAKRQKTMVIRAGIGIAALVVVVITVGAYLAIQSAAKAADNIKNALDNGDYQTALQLEPANLQALSMKKAADIKKALDSGDYLAALQLDPTNRQALSMKNAADNLRKALDKGDYHTALFLEPTNIQALSMKKAADIERIERTVL
ncbi:serine/threonine-protein kinase, partial [Mariniblastus sp.]|nr:serine/threonine-protein kinase [Mariniblastus sp.]